MSAERHARQKQLFHDALDRPRAERAAFLQQACGGDAELLAEVSGMLAVEDRASAFLGSVPLPGAMLASTAAPPTQLGPFRILRLLGEGGMGAVYEAEQDRPRRKVALKVLHPGTATPQMLRRFELESEVLGRLEHPGIARIYEAGASDSGRGPQPWFAMELVLGEPLRDHCTAHALPLEQRVELLARVADAVQHAHQRGIVHRDLKPANVLVDRAGQPKVLDFGIARVTAAGLAPATLRTDPGMIVGTLQYMSPEQASADPGAVDVRTDVYALGVMLYELVAGRPPLELGRLPMPEALRRVHEVEPPPLRATARVPVDVAVIAHKALAKDKEQRYASAAELAADLRRFLRKEPIAAHPPSGWYRLRRFAARNKALVGGAAATFAALVVGLLVALWQRNEARQALARVEGINRFLFSDLFASPSPEKLGRDVRVVDVLAPAALSAERAFAAEPRVAAEVLAAVGASYRALGLLPEAERLLRRALELLGDRADDRLALRTRGRMVALLTELDRAEQAVALGEAVVAASIRQLGADDPETLQHRADLALAHWDAGRQQRAIDDLRLVVGDLRRVLGDDDPRTLDQRSQLAVNLAAHGEIAEAQQLLTDTIAAQEHVLGPEHPGTLGSRNHLGWMLTLGSDWPAAEALHRQLLPAFESVYGADHPYTARVRVDMAQAPMHLQRVGEAEALVRTACADLERRLGKGHAWTVQARLSLVEVLFRKGDHAAAIAEATRIVELARAVGGEHLGHALMKLGRSHQEAGDDRSAAAVFRETAGIYRAAFGKPTDFLAQALYNLGVATRDAGDPQAAIAPLQEALELDVALWGAGHRHVVADRYNLARTLLLAGQPAPALAQMREVMAAAPALDLERWRVLGYQQVLGQALLELRQDEEAERTLVAVVEGCLAIGRPDDGAARRARQGLVALYERQGRPQDAARHR